MGFGSHTTFYRYLVGRDVVIHTDHQAWQKLNLRKPTGIFARMLIDINAISPKVIWIKGIRNIVADCLSRLVPVLDEDVCPIYEVPPSLWQSVIAAYHGGENGAHLSKASTLLDLQQKYHWDDMMTAPEQKKSSLT